jgi:hypothetical protein
MSQPTDKSIRGRRLLQKNRHIARQMSIRRAHAFTNYGTPGIPAHESPHRYHKVSGVTCGDSNCFMCGNPRKFFDERTMQEQRQMQDVESIRNRHSNGIFPKDTE